MKFGGNGPAIVAPDIIGLRKDRPAYHLIRYRNGVGQREPGVAKHDFVWHPIVRRDQGFRCPGPMLTEMGVTVRFPHHILLRSRDLAFPTSLTTFLQTKKNKRTT